MIRSGDTGGKVILLLERESFSLPSLVTLENDTVTLCERSHASLHLHHRCTGTALTNT